MRLKSAVSIHKTRLGNENVELAFELNYKQVLNSRSTLTPYLVQHEIDNVAGFSREVSAAIRPGTGRCRISYRQLSIFKVLNVWLTKPSISNHIPQEIVFLIVIGWWIYISDNMQMINDLFLNSANLHWNISIWVRKVRVFRYHYHFTRKIWFALDVNIDGCSTLRIRYRLHWFIRSWIKISVYLVPVLVPAK